MFCDFCQPGSKAAFVCVATGQVDIQLMVPGLAGHEATVQRRKARIFERDRQQAHAFAATGLDDSAAQKDVD